MIATTLFMNVGTFINNICLLSISDQYTNFEIHQRDRINATKESFSLKKRGD